MKGIWLNCPRCHKLEAIYLTVESENSKTLVVKIQRCNCPPYESIMHIVDTAIQLVEDK